MRADRPSIEEMYVAHRLFRREFTLIPRLVRATADGDTGRAAVVGGHLRTVLDGLARHHGAEDVVLWPRLLGRVRPSAPLVVGLLARHEDVEDAELRVRPLLAAWTAGASAVRGEQLARAVDDMAAGLLAQLDHEERELLPLVSRHLTAAEWALLAEHAHRAVPLRALPLVLGLELEGATARERAVVLRRAPWPVRVFMRLVGFRRYRRYARRVRGGESSRAV